MPEYYVRSSGGSDSNTGLSFAQGWATIQKALDTATSNGDVILVCSDGVHNVSSSLDTTASIRGAYSNPIFMRGAGPTGADDGSIATIAGSGIGSEEALLYVYPSSYREFSGLIFTTSNEGYGVQIPQDVTQGSIVFKDCRFTDHVRGVYIQTNATAQHDFTFINCEFDDCTAGLLPFTRCSAINCSFHDNVGSGVYSIKNDSGFPGWDAYGCVFYRNGANGISFITGSGASWGMHIKNNVFFNNGSSGIAFDNITTTGRAVVMNNIFKNNGAYGIYIPSGVVGSFAYCDHNCYYNNTSGAVSFNGGTPFGNNNILADPLFLSETAGSEDFRLQSGSPCKNVGSGYNG
jgi:hypothetical protein